MDSPAIVVSLAAAILSGISVFTTLARNKVAEVRELQKQHELVVDRLARVEVKVDVFWQKVGKAAAEVLHSPHAEHWRRDQLIEKFQREELTWEEIQEFWTLLTAIKEDHQVLRGERLAASLVLQALAERYDLDGEER
jgi:hypothetical protein